MDQFGLVFMLRNIWSCSEMDCGCLNVTNNCVIGNFFFLSFFFNPLKSPFTGVLSQWKYTFIAMEAADLEVFIGQINLSN